MFPVAAASELRPLFPLRGRGQCLTVAVSLVALYLGMARLGLMFAINDGVVTAVWPPAGIALGGLLVFGLRFWPAVWVGSFLANLVGLASPEDPDHLGGHCIAAIISATGSSLAALVSARVLLGLGRGRNPLATPAGVFHLLLVGGFGGSLISATVGSSAICLIGHAMWADFSLLWLTWWAGDLVGVFLFAPLLVAWFSADNLSMPARRGEALACIGALAIVARFVFFSSPGDLLGGEPRAFLCLPLMVWMSLRLGSRGVVTGLVVLAAFTVWGTAHQMGPFGRIADLNHSLLALNSFLGVAVAVCLAITAAVWRQQETASELREANRLLESRVADRTRSLQEAADHLRSSQQQLELAIEAANIGYWNVDVATRTAQFSAIWWAQLGRPVRVEREPADAWTGLLHPEDRSRVTAALEEFLQGRTVVFDQEFRLQHRDGAYRWIHSLGKVVPAGGGQSDGRLFGCHIDVTSQKQTELRWAALATLARQLNTATSVTHAARMMVEVADTLLGWDAAAVVMLDADSGLSRTVLKIDLANGQRTEPPPGCPPEPPSPRFRRTLAAGADLVVGAAAGEPAERGATSQLYVPIRNGQNAVGMLSIQRYQAPAYTPADLETLQTLADECGGALARIRSEELQEEAESRLREAQALAQVGSFYWHPRSNQVTWSPELYRLLGLRQEAAAPTLAAQLAVVHPDDQAPFQAALHAAAQASEAVDHDHRVVWPDGEVRWLHLRARGRSDATGEIVGVEGTCQDITERKQTTERLALFRGLIEQVTESLEIIELETGRFLDVNTRAYTDLGYSREEMLALAVPDIDPQVDWQRYHAVAQQLRVTGSFTIESQHRRKDGSVFPVEVSLKLASWGRPYVTAVVRDITERKRQADALRESQERLALAAQAVQIAFWDWNLQTQELRLSPEWKAQIGYGAAELAAAPELLRELLHPEDRDAIVAQVMAYVNGRETDCEAEFRLRHKDGVYRWIYSRGRLLRDEQGRRYRLMGGHLDITARKHAEVALRESREQLRLLFETANDAILFSTPGGRILAANQAACQLLQYTENELRQRGRQGITDPADPRVAVAVRSRDETGSYRGEMTFVRQDGSQFEGEVATAVVDARAEQRLATVVIRDVTERRRSEAEQARALSLLQATIESTSEGLLVVDREGNILIHNQRFIEMWRLPEELQKEQDDDRLLRFVLEQLQAPDEFLATVRHLYAHPELDSFETLRFKDGRIFERFSQPQRARGEIVGRVWSFRDVTEQRRAEAALRESESRLHLALEVACMGAWDWDLQTNLVVADSRVSPLYGGPGVPRLVREAEYQKYIHPEDRAVVNAAVQQAIHVTNYYHAIFRVIWAYGAVRWLESSGNVFRDETGRALRMVGVTADITERREAEESLRRSQQQYAELVNNIDGIVWEADAVSAQMTFVSPQAERILGYPVTDWTSSATFWEDHLHPADRDAALRFCHERAKLGLPYEFEYRMVAADGRSVWIRDLVKVEMENNLPVKLRGILLDITASKLADNLTAGQSRVLELIARSTALPSTLTELCLLLQAQQAGTFCSVLLTDEQQNRLVDGVAPSLPEAYMQAISGLAIGPEVGCCGTAAHCRERVVTRDISTDPRWGGYRAIALQHGLRSCWSLPILDPHRQVLGTFAIYRSIPWEPSGAEISVVESVSHTAAVAILKHRADQQLSRSAEILRQLSANLLATQEAERRHLARELHDEIGQTLTATKLLLDGMHQDLGPRAAAIRKPLDDAISHVNRLLQQVRALSLSLRPPMLDDFGLGPALRWLLDQHTRATGHVVTFDAGTFTAKPAAALETACFRIAQEALTNISRHAQARHVSVALHNDVDSFTLVVRDDGRGFDVAAAKARALKGGSLGLLGQQERAALVGGRVEIVSTAGSGTEVRVWFPLVLEE